MRYAFFVLFMLCCTILPAMAEESEARPHAVNLSPNLSEPMYNKCKADDECAVVIPPCGTPMTFNKQSQLLLQGYFNSVATTFSCADWLKVPRVVKTMCVKERCAIELTAPQVPPPQTAFQKDPQYCEKDSDCETVIGACCEAKFLNKPHADRLRADMEYSKDAPNTCFNYDRRKVKNLRCVEKQCTADLEIPLELDYNPRDLRDCSKWK